MIKSIFEIIAEKGKKTSEIRNNIKLREMIRNFNGNKNMEKKYIKIHKIKKIKVEENTKKAYKEALETEIIVNKSKKKLYCLAFLIILLISLIIYLISKIF